MADPATRTEESLPEFLAERARRAPDGRLVAHLAGGLLGVSAAVYWGGSGWLLLLSLNVCFLAFGMWAIAERVLGERADAAGRATSRTLVVIRLVCGTLGFLGAAFLMMSVLAKLLGRIIS